MVVALVYKYLDYEDTCWFWTDGRPDKYTRVTYVFKTEKELGEFEAIVFKSARGTNRIIVDMVLPYAKNGKL